MKTEDELFYQGFAVAIGTLIRAFDQPSMATDIMVSNGVSYQMLRNAKVEDFDLSVIRKAWRAAT